jgi:hypothetical protein
MIQWHVPCLFGLISIFLFSGWALYMDDMLLFGGWMEDLKK